MDNERCANKLSNSDTLKSEKMLLYASSAPSLSKIEDYLKAEKLAGSNSYWNCIESSLTKCIPKEPV
jgi:hypothetical protein